MICGNQLIYNLNGSFFFFCLFALLLAKYPFSTRFLHIPNPTVCLLNGGHCFGNGFY